MTEEVKCALCGRTFYPHHGLQKYCSPECYRSRAKYERQRRAGLKANQMPTVKKCAYCGKEFIPSHPNRKYCSGECKCRAEGEWRKKFDENRRKHAKEKPPGDKPHSIDDTIAALREQGVSYADRQKAETLEMIGRIEIVIPKTKSPCRDCANREPGCHGKCDKYKAFRGYCEKMYEAKMESNSKVPIVTGRIR